LTKNWHGKLCTWGVIHQIHNCYISTALKLPVQAAVLDGFGNVGGANIFFTGKVRDGAGYFDNAVVRPHGKSKGIKSAAQKIAGFPVEGTKFLDVASVMFTVLYFIPQF
jgi:hypothetical protein